MGDRVKGEAMAEVDGGGPAVADSLGDPVPFGNTKLATATRCGSCTGAVVSTLRCRVPSVTDRDDNDAAPCGELARGSPLETGVGVVDGECVHDSTASGCSAGGCEMRLTGRSRSALLLVMVGMPATA